MSGKKMKVNITPSPSILNRITAVDFGPVPALSELIANSFDARIGGSIPVRVTIDWSAAANRIMVIDDARGMGVDDLKNALSLGKSEKEAYDKGTYGMGLKSAAGYLGSLLEIETCKHGTNIVLRTAIDYKEFAKRSSSSSWDIEIEEISRKDSTFFYKENTCGTAITIKRLHVQEPRIEEIRRGLANTFYYHLRKGSLDVKWPPVEVSDSIIVNEEEIKRCDEELIPNTYEEIDFEIEYDKKRYQIRGWVGLLKKSAPNTGTYGFHIYRNRQMVEEYCKDFTWPLSTMNSKVFGHIHLDFLNVNFNKIGLMKNNRLYYKVRDQLIENLEKYKKASAAGLTRTVKGKKLTDREMLQRMFDCLGKDLPDNLEERGEQNDPVQEPEELSKYVQPVELSSVVMTDEPIEKKVGKPIEAFGRQIRFEFKNIQEPTNQWRWRFHTFDADRGTLTIFINTESTIYMSLTAKDKEIFKNHDEWKRHFEKSTEALRRIALIECLIQMEEAKESHGQAWHKKWDDSDHTVHNLVIEGND